MASIIEKETAVPEERTVVASVYYNRLARNIALQADPSVIYAELLNGNYCGALHHADMRFQSAYNTYTHPDFRPGPSETLAATLSQPPCIPPKPTSSTLSATATATTVFRAASRNITRTSPGCGKRCRGDSHRSARNCLPDADLTTPNQPDRSLFAYTYVIGEPNCLLRNPIQSQCLFCPVIGRCSSSCLFCR